MKLATPVLAFSLAANVALGWLVCSRLRDAGMKPFPGQPAAGESKRAASVSTTSTASAKTDTAMALRDRLRALGLTEDDVRAAVRAQLEAPRVAQEREMLRDAANKFPWWRVPIERPETYFRRDPALREMRKAERAEMVRVFGPAGDVTRAERERYAFLPEDKAARLAALERDYKELKGELPTGPGAPRTRAEVEAREKLLQAEYDRDLAALLTPEERVEVEHRTSVAAWSVALHAKYFTASEEEFGKVFDLTKAQREAAGMDRPMVPGRAAGGIEALKKYTNDLIALFGPERFAQWNRAQQHDYQALVELQRRFTVPAATIDGLNALPRLVGEEGLKIGQDHAKSEEERLAGLRDLAARTREKIRSLLGPDLGDAYSDAAARGWLDELDRGSVPFVQENGQRAIFLISHQPIRSPSLRPAPVKR